MTREEFELKLAEVRENAYYRWVYAGSPPGSHLEFWLEAEMQVLGMPAELYWERQKGC